MSPRAERLPWVDMLRGAALVGMIAYHMAWDLHAFGMSGIDPGTDPGLRVFGRGVASLFLALSGFSLGLAIRQGRGGVAMVLRLVRVAAAAGLVSAATLVVAPQAPIWFGILHCIVVTNAIALGLRGLPATVLLAIAAAAWCAPELLSGVLGPAWAWTGLAATEPETLDFRPILPWLAPVLVGLVLGRTRMGRWPRPRPVSPRPGDLLSWAGRHSLGIYLVHQPFILGALIAVSHGAGWHIEQAHDLRDPIQAGAFLRQCRADCAAAGGEGSLCRSTCGCVLTRVAPTGAVQSPGLDLDRSAIAAAVAACQKGDRDVDQ